MSKHGGKPNEPNEPQIPAGGWGSVKEVTTILLKERVPLEGTQLLMQQNKPDGFMCVSCSWAKPAHPHPAEFCESGAKATAWEITSKRLDPAFFKRHTLRELEGWNDHELEEAGRLTVPMRYDGALDRYVEITWDRAFAEIGAELRKMDPAQVAFYSSGRASLETSYMYQLLARMYGNNNLPDSSNMCHESTSVALPKTIGVPIGTVVLDDFEQTDCIFFFGQNVGVNSPRMLHQLQEARKRGVPIVTFNPLRERGLVSFVNPQSPVEMLSGHETVISTQYHQVKAGGDVAALTGLCKAVLEADERARTTGGPRALDTAFIDEHCHGFDEFAAAMRARTWDEIEKESGLTQGQIEQAAGTYLRAKQVIGIYGMGLTQHRNGVLNVQMLVNFLLLRGNMGKPGAGICPVRGHSNVQGQRTVGITEKPELAPLDKLKELYGFEPPRAKGMNTVEMCEAIKAGKLQALISLGGNLVRAVPDHGQMEAAWRAVPLTVQISTKLNRSHLVHGKTAYLLPCLGRIEIDRQASGEQSVSMEDSTGCMHGSRGRAEPAADTLLSEPAIVARLAKATLDPNPKVDWDGWVADYAKCATPSPRRTRRSSTTSTSACGSRAASANRWRQRTANGTRPPARRISPCRTPCPRTPTCPCPRTPCACSRCAATASSTRRSTALKTVSGACRTGTSCSWPARTWPASAWPMVTLSQPARPSTMASSARSKACASWNTACLPAALPAISRSVIR